MQERPRRQSATKVFLLMMGIIVSALSFIVTFNDLGNVQVTTVILTMLSGLVGMSSGYFFKQPQTPTAPTS